MRDRENLPTGGPERAKGGVTTGRGRGEEALYTSIDFPSMAYLYDKDGEDLPLDLVEYAVISHPDPVGFPSFPLQQFDSLRRRI